MLLLELLEPSGESLPLASDDRDLGCLQAVAEFRSGGVDDAVGQDALGDRVEDRLLHERRADRPMDPGLIKSLLQKALTRDEPHTTAAQPDDLGDRRGELPSEALKLAASGGALDVVGESHYRDAIESATGGPRTEGIRMIRWASLLAEHDNLYDPHAVGVLLDEHKVGHLSRDDAAAFWPLLDLIQEAGRVAYCRADTYGGWNTSPMDRGEYLITLYASGPASQASRIAKEIDGKSKAEIAAARPSLTRGSEPESAPFGVAAIPPGTARSSVSATLSTSRLLSISCSRSSMRLRVNP